MPHDGAERTAGPSRAFVVAVLGTSQTLAWASSYYLPAVLADPIAVGLDVPSSLVFAAFTVALLIAALTGPAVGRLIDSRGGRDALAASNLILAIGLAAMADSRGPASLALAWSVVGVGMAFGLYDAGFAALAALYGREARGPITGITLFAVFASTVSWPATAVVVQSFGWRAACLSWAAVNLVIALPLNLSLPRSARSPVGKRQVAAAVSWKPYREMLLLAFVFSAAWFVTGSMAAHLPELLVRAGVGAHAAIAAAALVGPAQVAARVAEFLLLRRIHPLVSAMVAATLHPLGAAALSIIGPAAAPLFVVLYGAGNGLLTIARGTVPLALFGPRGYGERTGLLGAPARTTQAMAPLVFGLLLDRMGVDVISVTSALCLMALGALIYLRLRPPARSINAEL